MDVKGEHAYAQSYKHIRTWQVDRFTQKGGRQDNRVPGDDGTMKGR